MTNMPKNFRAISTSILPGQSGSRIRETTDQVYQVPSAIYLVAELSILFFPFIVTLASQFNKIQASTILIVSHR
jgi:hypothetical protein